MVNTVCQWARLTGNTPLPRRIVSDSSRTVKEVANKEQCNDRTTGISATRRSADDAALVALVPTLSQGAGSAAHLIRRTATEQIN